MSVTGVEAIHHDYMRPRVKCAVGRSGLLVTWHSLLRRQLKQSSSAVIHYGCSVAACGACISGRHQHRVPHYDRHHVDSRSTAFNQSITASRQIMHPLSSHAIYLSLVARCWVTRPQCDHAIPVYPSIVSEDIGFISFTLIFGYFSTQKYSKRHQVPNTHGQINPNLS